MSSFTSPNFATACRVPAAWRLAAGTASPRRRGTPGLGVGEGPDEGDAGAVVRRGGLAVGVLAGRRKTEGRGNQERWWRLSTWPAKGRPKQGAELNPKGR